MLDETGHVKPEFFGKGTRVLMRQEATFDGLGLLLAYSLYVMFYPFYGSDLT